MEWWSGAVVLWCCGGVGVGVGVGVVVVTVTVTVTMTVTVCVWEGEGRREKWWSLWWRWWWIRHPPLVVPGMTGRCTKFGFSKEKNDICDCHNSTPLHLGAVSGVSITTVAVVPNAVEATVPNLAELAVPTTTVPSEADSKIVSIVVFAGEPAETENIAPNYKLVIVTPLFFPTPNKEHAKCLGAWQASPPDTFLLCRVKWLSTRPQCRHHKALLLGEYVKRTWRAQASSRHQETKKG